MNKEFTFLDFLTILSFLIGFYALLIAMQNLEENREQTLQTEEVLYKMDKHLHLQDGDLKEIKGMKGESRGDTKVY